MRRQSDYYDNYRTIEARFDSVGFCGHSISKGETIGYNGRLRRARCAACWRKWQEENIQADYQERAYSY